MNVEEEIKSIVSRLEKLEQRVFSSSQENTKYDSYKVNFDLDHRAFMNKYAKNLSGHARFTLIVAYLVKGELNSAVNIQEIIKIWKNTEGLLGGKYRSMFATRARTNGWVGVKDTKRGEYILKREWEEVFKRNE